MSDSADHHATLCSVLARLRRRQRVLGCVRGAARGLLAGAIAIAAIGVAAWLGAVGADVFSPSIWLMGAVAPALLGLVIGAVVRVDDLQVSRALDRAAGSQDRFASAVQLAGHHCSCPAHRGPAAPCSPA